MASQPTVSRLENSVRRADLVRMGYAMADNFIASYAVSPNVLRYCDRHHLRYVIGLSGNAVLKPRIEPLMAEARAVFAQSQTPVKLYESFTYKADTWDSPQRVVAKAEVNAKGDNPRFVVTNLTDPDDATVYKYLYCGRGQMENYIKDHKIYLKSDRTSCHEFTANQFRLFLHSAAYVLLQAFRENVLHATQFAHAQFDIIRLNLLKIGARVIELKTKISLHLPSSYPHKPILSKITALFQTLSATPIRC